ncbi:MAG: arabinose efflux permease family protein [Sphingobacteriaceae bacterium]|jgi:MFS family permease|nr:arabinose efflux permease family protein [Sphingobacteriaceae bacterium]
MSSKIQLGLRQNWKQFTLLIIINAFVGGMIGLERSILPELAREEFGIVAKSALLSFIVVFGFTKAIANYFAGALANTIGRRKLLIYGWLFAIPVPIILISAESWTWVVASNVLLGISQGLTWSSTVVMKIDLVGEKNRGLAMGLNEFAGYLAVALVALLTGFIASEYGLRPYPFYIGIAISFLGLAGSIFLIKDTRGFVLTEKKTSTIKPLDKVFLDTGLRHPNLSSITQAGLVNNLNDGMVWGLLPLLLSTQGYGLKEIGMIVSIYPAVWGLGQLFTGKLADRINKKTLLFWGMLAQGLALLLLIPAFQLSSYVLISVILGIGTAVVYPTFLAAIADETRPEQRAESLGIFRLWRDSGYAFGAILSGILADSFGLSTAIATIGGLTVLSSLVVQLRMIPGLKKGTS